VLFLGLLYDRDGAARVVDAVVADAPEESPEIDRGGMAMLVILGGWCMTEKNRTHAEVEMSNNE
jgi:hypothetical protein